jgi:hypothetical protein
MLTGVFVLQADSAWTPISVPAGEAAAPLAVCSRPVLHLTIDSAEQLPAAEAVIAALYGVPDALSSLPQQQLLVAAVIAGKVGAAGVVDQCVSMLKAAEEQAGSISAATMEGFAGLPAWPA